MSQHSKVNVMMIMAHDNNRVILRARVPRVEQIHTCATHEETKVGRGFDTTHRSKTL